MIYEIFQQLFVITVYTLKLTIPLSLSMGVLGWIYDQVYYPAKTNFKNLAADYLPWWFVVVFLMFVESFERVV